jgi:glycosyltransferase involved in cell wall biosynthesis
MSGRRPRVLVSAYACEPNRGSEPGVGWNLVQQMARHCDVWVITRANNRSAIESEPAGTGRSRAEYGPSKAGDPLGCAGVDLKAQAPEDSLHFAYFDLPRWGRFWKEGKRGVYLYYYLWQIGAWRLARRLHREIGFDIVHHATFATYWMPSFLPGLPAPMVWGPVGGGEATPPSMYGAFTVGGRLSEYLRAAVQAVGRCDPFVRRTARRAAVALATTEETAARLRQIGAKDVRILSAVGIPREEIANLCRTPLRDGGPFRMAGVGLLLHWKGFALAIRALARLRQTVPDAELWLIGDGPDRARLQALANELGVEAGVRFTGAVRRAEVFGMLAECDILVHPSLHDSGAYVCAEAMAAGRPVICLDLGGPALQVTPECGIKVPAENPQQAVRDLAVAMQTLAANAPLRRRMSEGARRRVLEHLCWEQKGEQILAIYNDVLARPTRSAAPPVAIEVRS